MNFSEIKNKHSAKSFLRDALCYHDISDPVWRKTLVAIKYQIAQQAFFEVHMYVRQQLKDRHDI